ncbi:MAG: 4-alpha-glucanotransferase [Clostridiales bacterium]|jgi:4-alpha-glucanotransferase|nr:4-alpha-glucanotransferase [Clostridiales bacterium]
MRCAGILLPVFSLPNRYGIGSFGEEAYGFIDFLADCGQAYWQVLPIGPTIYGDSPYQPPSVYAGNPYFVAPGLLQADGWLSERECAEHRMGGAYIDYARLFETRYKLLETAYKRFSQTPPPDFAAFKEENAYWLDCYCLFMVVKGLNGGKAMAEWSAEHKNYRLQLERKAEYADGAEFWAFVQYCFFKQWNALKAYANGKGIRIIGDRPIYSALDSADVWANPEYFQLDAELNPTAVAGVPPDLFSEDGQLWGNPLYNWDEIKKRGFDFWTRNFDFLFKQFDTVRVDHFRGFAAYYSIPTGSATAKNGEWFDAPWREFFTALKSRYGVGRIITEDLGAIDDKVKGMLAFCGYPGMKIFEFAFGEDDSAYLPKNYPENCVAYTGTHDNMTCKQWLGALNGKERRRLRRTIKRRLFEGRVAACIRNVLNSRADTVIIPMQDYMELGAAARINFPSTLGGNWIWRLPRGYDAPKLKKHILMLTNERNNDATNQGERRQ